MYAKKDNVKGYSESVCYSCAIKPTGLPIITFKKEKPIFISAEKGTECTNALE